MATVTVCVPAYRVGSYICETLRSVQCQSHADLVVEIAVEPPAEETLEAIAPFLSDRRFRVVINPSRFGWDANIRALLRRVDTPFFIILPHDDILHPEYVATLLSALERRPDASVAYGDIFFFGSRSPAFKSLALPAGGSVEERLLAFFLAGAEAVPWRGVTRSAVIEYSDGFPVDGYAGFAVECEWALTLLLHGPAIHVPRPMYFKRMHSKDIVTASRARWRMFPQDQLLAAWAGHRTRMLEPLSAFDGPTPAAQLLPMIAEAAMLRRQIQALSSWTPVKMEQAEALVAAISKLAGANPLAADASSRMRRLLGLSPPGAASSTDMVVDRQHAIASSNAQVLVRLGQSRLREGSVLEALDLAARASASAPHTAGLGELLEHIAARLSTAYHHPATGSVVQ